MYLFLVKYKIKNAGYSPGDQCVSGGYYDKHDHVLIPASNKKTAVLLARNYVAIKHAGHVCTVGKTATLVGEIN